MTKNKINLCPEGLKEEIDRTIEAIYQPINNGVYRSGFATSQEAYEEVEDKIPNSTTLIEVFCNGMKCPYNSDTEKYMDKL